jgi:hypothetical protein
VGPAFGLTFSLRRTQNEGLEWPPVFGQSRTGLSLATSRLPAMPATRGERQEHLPCGEYIFSRTANERVSIFSASGNFRCSAKTPLRFPRHRAVAGWSGPSDFSSIARARRCTGPANPARPAWFAAVWSRPAAASDATVTVTAQTAPPTVSTSADKLPVALRIVVSAFLLVHLAAVIVPPLAGPPPASELAGRIREPLRPLIGALYLGHGYRFFAPNPGPGHTIRWTATLADGSEREGRIPDRNADRPRLLYHRRFMIAEKIAALVPPTDAPEEIRTRAKADWLPLVKGVAGHVLRTTGAAEVRLETIEHFLPGPDEVLAGTVEPDLVTPLGRYRLREATP